MFSVERHESIIRLLKNDRVVSVQDIARAISASPATVRRDLETLEKNGLVRRVYGGAMLAKANKDVPLSMREGVHTAEKSVIGRQAAALVKENDVIMLDASSTVYSMVQYLAEFRNILAITTGLKTAMALSERHVKTLVTGGVLIDNSYSFIGKHAEELIESVNADTLFFSCRGVSADGRLNDSSMEESQLRQMMFAHAKRRVFLADSSKIGKEYFYTLAGLEQIDDFICEAPLPQGWAQRLRGGRNGQTEDAR